MRKTFLAILALIASLTAPVAAEGWFPQINGTGSIVSGAGTITIDGRDVASPGWSPHWVDNRSVVYTDGASTVLLDVPTGARESVPVAYNFLAAGGGSWTGTLASGTPVTRHYRGTAAETTVEDAGLPLGAPGGAWGYATNYHGDVKTIVVNGRAVASGLVMDAALTDTAVVYSVATGRYTREVYAQPLASGAAIRSTIFDWESPTACDGPGGTWILGVTQRGLAFRPIGAQEGYYWRGEYFYPSCRFIAGRFVIASSTGRGELRVLDVAPDAPGRIAYATITDDCAACEASPIPPDEPDDPEPPPPAPADFPDYQSELATLRAALPTPMSAEQQAALLNALAWAHRAEGFGLERKDGGNSCPQPTTGIRVACDILRYDHGGAALGMDVLSDAEGEGRVVWGGPGPADPSRVVAPVAPAGAPTEPPPTEPPTTPPTDPAIQARVAVLEQLVATIQQRLTTLEQQRPSTPPPADAEQPATEKTLRELLDTIKGALSAFGR
jgi:hypothetical protein